MVTIIGLLLPTFLISRLLIYLLKKINLKQSLYFVAHFTSWIASSILNAWGAAENADNFIPSLIGSLIIILIPQSLWLLFDSIINKDKMLNIQTKRIAIIVSTAILVIAIRIIL